MTLPFLFSKLCLKETQFQWLYMKFRLEIRVFSLHHILSATQLCLELKFDIWLTAYIHAFRITKNWNDCFKNCSSSNRPPSGQFHIKTRLNCACFLPQSILIYICPYSLSEKFGPGKGQHINQLTIGLVHNVIPPPISKHGNSSCLYFLLVCGTHFPV